VLKSIILSLIEVETVTVYIEPTGCRRHVVAALDGERTVAADQLSQRSVAARRLSQRSEVMEPSSRWGSGGRLVDLKILRTAVKSE